ncbi:DUF5047 domain-containing protein [Ruania rhizosphaerae]|uniref:DUF5047 domain-containing protein n=1 Tax=Ruania rhizosphaerae TaxID=1840413 RepID=UPI00135B64F1|nr:DUF5047 domain-containing protein [Ruania rhizosphaerae]
MWPVTSPYLEAIQSPHEVVIRADVNKGGVRLYSDLPVETQGSRVSVAAHRITRRECTLIIAPRLREGVYGDRPALPESWDAPLGHYGQEITLRHGLVYPNGVVEWVPCGMYRIDDVDGSLLDQSGVQIKGVSREAWIADDRFSNPRTVSSSSAQQLITDLIQETDPAFVVIPSATQDARVRRTTFDEDRWDAITQIAKGIGAVVYADAAGRFVIRDAPTLDSPPVWRIASEYSTQEQRTVTTYDWTGTTGESTSIETTLDVVTRTNHVTVPRPREGEDLGPWGTFGGPVAVDEPGPDGGIGLLRLVGDGSGQRYAQVSVPMAGSNTAVHMSLWARSTADVTMDWARVSARDGFSTVASTDLSPIPLTAGEWAEVAGTVEVASEFDSARATVGLVSSTLPDAVELDFTMAYASTVAGPFFDGDTRDVIEYYTVDHAGVLVSADQSSSRERVYNRVVTRGENPSSGAPPVSAIATDTDSSSPTRYGAPSTGAYGHVTKFQAIPTITTVTQARRAAAAELARSTGAASSVDIGAVPNVALEALDVIDLWTDPTDANTIRRHVVDSITFDLAAGGRFQMSTRDIRQVVA